MSNTANKLTTKRFVIRQSLIGTNTIITVFGVAGYEAKEWSGSW